MKRRIAALGLGVLLLAGCGAPGAHLGGDLHNNKSFIERVDGRPLRCALFRLPNDAGSNAALTCDWSEYNSG